MEWRLFIPYPLYQDATVEAFYNQFFSTHDIEDRKDTYLACSANIGIKLRNEAKLEVKLLMAKDSVGIEEWSKETFKKKPLGIQCFSKIHSNNKLLLACAMLIIDEQRDRILSYIIKEKSFVTGKETEKLLHQFDSAVFLDVHKQRRQVSTGKVVIEFTEIISSPKQANGR